MKKKKIVVFTDGSCSGNGKKNSYGGIGIHFPNKELNDVSKVYRKGYCTNQKTELFAILTAIRYIKQNIGLKNVKVLIKTDSEYSINCVTRWVNGWIKNGWKTKNDTDVANKEFIEPIYKYYKKYDIEFEHVEAHTGYDDDDSVGNDKADKLATKATEKAIRESGGKCSISKGSGGKCSGKKGSGKKESGKSYISKGFPSGNNFVVELIKSKN